MSDQIPAQPADTAAELLEWRARANQTADDAQAYLDTLTEMAAGSSPERAFPVMLLALSQIVLSRCPARRGHRHRPERAVRAGRRPRRGHRPAAGRAGQPVRRDRHYADIVDPLTSLEVVRGTLSDDLADVAADLSHGLKHYRAGRFDEALWWWQFSYFSTWGFRATSALRVLQSVIGHIRLDVDAETVADAEFEALHAP